MILFSWATYELKLTVLGHAKKLFRMETIFEICHTPNMSLDVTVNLLVKRI